MKKYIILAILTLFFTIHACNKVSKEDNKEISLLDLSTSNCYNEHIETKEFDLDIAVNFKDLLQNLDSISCQGQKPVIVFNRNVVKYKISPCHSCPKNSLIFCTKQRNELYIEKDSIRIDNFTKITVDSLRTELRRHILNKQKEFKYAESPDKAFVSISVDSLEKIDTIKNILVEIAEEFRVIKKEYNDSLNLNIQFKKNFIFNLPSPPKPKK